MRNIILILILISNNDVKYLSTKALLFSYINYPLELAEDHHLCSGSGHMFQLIEAGFSEAED